MIRSTISSKNYPNCKESHCKLSKTIFIQPCYAQDGSESARRCIPRPPSTTSGILQSDLGVYDHTGQRHTSARQ